MCLLLAIGFMLSIPFSVYAAESPAVVGLNIDEDGAGLFLYGDLPQGLAAKVSGQDCEVEVVGLAESESDIRTLLLIDISTSMRQGSQKQVIDALTALIDSKGENEQYAIAAFGVEYNLLVDFTSDRYDLIKAVEQLAWDGQGSSIYRAVDAATDTADKDQQNDGTFTQVVLFSDGVEKAEDGIIKEELFFSLKEAPLPVHTIGFQYENNAEGLKELYAISRMTGGFSFGLTAGTSSSEAISQVAQYIAEVNCVDIRLPEQVKDGAVRPLELLDGSGGQILMYDLHMPVSAQPSSAPESTPPPSAAPAPALHKSRSQRRNQRSTYR